MKRQSRKHRQRQSSVTQWRDDFRWRVQRCEFCLRPAGPENLDVHECVPGSSRQKALDKEYAVLALTRDCHEMIERLSIPFQLAYLLRARPEEFSLEKYWKLIGRNWPSAEEVLFFWEQLP